MQSSTRPLPNKIKLEFFAAICGDKTTDEFEQWLYGSSEVEAALSSDDYLDLLALDYSAALASVNLIGILEKLVSAGEYETWRLKKLLQAFLDPSEEIEELSKLLIAFYDLYCRGVRFLKALGLEYGLLVVCLDSDLSPMEREQFVEALLPNARKEANKVLHYLENGIVKILDERCTCLAYD